MTVSLSRSEIKSEVEKAIRGVGFDWGRAKDGGVMAAWLAAHDLVFLGGLLRGLDTFDKDANTDAVFAPVDAMMISELVVASGKDWSGYAVGLRFMVAAMGIVSNEQSVSLTLSNEHSIIAHANQGNVYISKAGDFADCYVTLAQSQSFDRDDDFMQCMPSLQSAHDASESCWKRLGTLAHKVYVKETEEKRRSGAGAGDIDNT